MQLHFQNANKDFLMSYTTIGSPEQRAHYKREFNTHYNKYILLHKVLDGVRARFTSLEARLRGATKGSLEFEKIKGEIVAEYEKNKRDAAYQEARHNFQYLHEKLAHLKQLVHDYDTAHR